MATVTKKDLMLNVSDKTQENIVIVQDVVHALFDEVIDQLGQGNRIELRDFGVFSFKKRAPRTGHNPRTLEKVQVSAKVVVSFKMGKRMRDVVAAMPLGDAEGEGSQMEQAQAPAGIAPAGVQATESGIPPPTHPPDGVGAPQSPAEGAMEPPPMGAEAPPDQGETQAESGADGSGAVPPPPLPPS